MSRRAFRLAAGRDLTLIVAQIVDLSRKQSSLREASRAVSTRIKTRGEHGTWVAAGNTFIKLPASKVKSFLEDGECVRGPEPVIICMF